MAFDSFRAQERGRPRTLRRIAFALVVFFHGVLIAAGIAYSYWHVEELTPPTLRVTFMSAPPPPPPPPPPPAGGGSRAKKVALRTKPVEPIVVPKPNEIVQPPEKKPVKKEFRKHTDEYVEEDDTKPTAVGNGKGKGAIDGDEDGEDDGVVGGQKGGQKGGQIGGIIGGSGTTPMAPKILAPNVGALQREGCALPRIPPSLNRKGASFFVIAKVCVSRAGVVENVTLLKKEDTLLDNGVVDSEKACHYKPLVIGSTTVPFCYVANYKFNVE